MTGQRPSIDLEKPNLRLDILIRENQVQLSANSSGASLHRRGYKQYVGKAPINEVLAAGMVLLSDWDRRSPLLDPMCGSGTILIEAALLAAEAPVNPRREFGFMHWKDFDSKLWNDVLKEALAKQNNRDIPPIFGFDLDRKMIRYAAVNAQNADLDNCISFEKKKLEELVPPTDHGTLIFNPPYDERLTDEDIYSFYGVIGDSLKHNFQGFTAWLITSNMEALKHVGLRTSKRVELKNGPLPCRFVRYEMYTGSKKQKKR